MLLGLGQIGTRAHDATKKSKKGKEVEKRKVICHLLSSRARERSNGETQG